MVNPFPQLSCAFAPGGTVVLVILAFVGLLMVSVLVLSNDAVTVRFALTVKVHVVNDPEQEPPHELNTLPLSAVAVRVTSVPGATVIEHTSPEVPQLIPAGAEVIEPLVGSVTVTV